MSSCVHSTYRLLRLSLRFLIIKNGIFLESRSTFPYTLEDALLLERLRRIRYASCLGITMATRTDRTITATAAASLLHLPIRGGYTIFLHLGRTSSVHTRRMISLGCRSLGGTMKHQGAYNGSARQESVTCSRGLATIPCVLDPDLI